jgi:peptidoglycan/LPS O-acetylase OafA/YrhL
VGIASLTIMTAIHYIGQPGPTLKNSTSNEPLLRPAMPELDSIRGIAILAVLFYHGFYWNVDLAQFSKPVRLVLAGIWVGRLGVNLFFVLSGFLITGILIDSKWRTDYYSRFYKRRALRILPAYLLTILVLVGVKHSPWNFIGLSLLYLSNLTPLFGVAIAYPVLWSLAVEEHFYFLWPTIVRKLPSRQLMFFCIAIIVLSPLSRLVTFYWSRNNGAVSFVGNDYTWNSADGLACGALLSVWMRTFQPTRLQVRRTISALVIVVMGIYLVGLHWGIWTRQRPLGAALQVVPWHLFFVALILAFLIFGTSPWRYISQAKALRFFGEISYGLYLYHLLVFEGFDYLAARNLLPLPKTGPGPLLLIRFTVASSVAVTIAYVSRRLFEDRFLRLKGRFTSA